MENFGQEHREEHRVPEASLANLKPPWQPGQSGNPGGRPKGSTFAADLLDEVERELAGGLTVRRAIAKRLVRICLEGEASCKGARQAIKDLIERVDGKVPDRIEVTEVNKGYDVGNSPEAL